jgi:hypothetical protein
VVGWYIFTKLHGIFSHNTQYSLCLTVPDHLLTSSTAATAPPAPTGSTSALGHPDSYGCTIDSTFYTAGAQVGLKATRKLHLYGCFLAENHLCNVKFSFRYQEIPESHVNSATASATRRHAACGMQECTLQVEGCRPVYQPGVCCPVRYDCGKCNSTFIVLSDEDSQRTLSVSNY